LPTPGEAHAKLSKRLAARASTSTSSKKPNAEVQAWQAAGLHCSANERRADEASRDVEAWLKCKYMKEHLGEEFSGLVTSVTSFGVFVTLDAMYVEGLVHITELGGEYYRFDEARQELRGERTGIRYALGSRVQVQVSRVDLDGRRIDFRLVPSGDDVATRAWRDKAGSKDGEREGPESGAKMSKTREKTSRSNSEKSAPRKSASRGEPAAKSGKPRKGKR
jgi:ribonuclease R